MRLLRALLSTAILLTAIEAVSAKTSFAQTDDACVLPSDLQEELATKYRTLRTATLSDLEEDDRRFFLADHDKSCPGVVKVDFYGDGKPTLALVLVSKKQPTDTSRLVVAHNPGHTWEITPLDTGGQNPSTPVVWSLPPGTYSDVYGNKSIQATKPVIVFCKYESWAILYAWRGTHVSKIWLMD